MTGLRSQLERARAEKEKRGGGAERGAGDAGPGADGAQEPRPVRARERPSSGQTRGKSLSLVEEMTKEVEQLKSQKAELTRKNSGVEKYER